MTRPHIDRHWRQPGYEAPDCRVHARPRGFLFTFPIVSSVPADGGLRSGGLRVLSGDVERRF